jgi:hypothetical protein
MELPITGGCACGAIRYECAAEPMAAVNCHCRDCQRASGSGYAPALWFPADAVRITRGQVKYHLITAETGNTVSRGFCADCGSPLLAKNSAAPMVIVRAGSLDDPTLHRPQLDIFVSSAQPWDHMDPALPKYPRGLA